MAKGIKEIWFTTTKKGQKQAWFYGYVAMRAFRMPLVDAELAIMTGQAVETTKPMWVGGK